MASQKTRHLACRACVAAASALLALVGLLAGGAAAQEVEADTPTFEERMEVTEVLLDVLVTDRGGNLVAGLGPGDFLVEEDGRAMKLNGADFYSTRYLETSGDPSVPGSDSPPASAIPASRYVIFFLHDSRTMSNRLNRLARQQLIAARDCRRWIEEEMQPSDWVAVTGWGMRLKIYQDFTQDREALVEAINNAGRGTNPDKDRWTRPPVPPTAPSLLRHLPSGKELGKKTRRIYEGLRLLAEATGHVVGRKTLLYFGIGFGDLSGLDNVAIGDRRYYPEMERALNDNNVAVYPIDLTIQGTRHAQSSFLNALANDTGGVYYRNFASFLGPLVAITEANVGYYVLSYRSEHPAGESGYQRVKVRMTSPGLEVSAQRGYRYGSDGGKS